MTPPTSTSAHRPNTTSTSPKKWSISAPTLGDGLATGLAFAGVVAVLQAMGQDREALGREGVDDGEEEDRGRQQVQRLLPGAGGEHLVEARPGQRRVAVQGRREPELDQAASASRCISAHSASTWRRSVGSAPIETRTIQRPSRIAGVR